MTQRIAHSVCPLDCADTCSLEVTLEHDRVTGVRGGRDNPVTRGRLCAKVSRGLAAQVHDPNRITAPLLRNGSKTSDGFEAVSWETALDIIAERYATICDRWGPQAIAPLYYGGPMGLLAGNSMDKRFFHRLGASLVDPSPLCAGTSRVAWQSLFGDAGGIDYQELVDSALILVWGNNVTTCNLHLTRTIREARRRGAALVVIDPKQTRIAREADLHIPLLPGTDIVLAYATAALLEEMGGLDEDFLRDHTTGADAFLAHARQYTPERAALLCGIPQEHIHQLAHYLRSRAPAAMSLGVAPERNRNGGAGIRGALSLLVLTGNIGPRGAGPCDTGRFFPVQDEALTRPDLAPGESRTLNALDIPRYVLEPGQELPIRGLFIYNHNPVAVHPQQGRMRQALLSDDVFVVGSDICMTDSMACADLVLPAPTHLEYPDLYTAYGHRYLQRTEAVMPPQGAARSNTDLFRSLARRMGFEEPCFADTDDELMVQAFRHLPENPALLARDGAIDMTPYAEAALGRGATLSTPSGRIKLYSAALEAECGEGLPRFKPLPNPRQFIVVSPASEHRINSTFGGLPGHADDVCCEIHPEDARHRGVTEGARIALSNDQGSIELVAVISSAVPPGVLYVPKGAWLGASGEGTINSLIPGHRADLGEGACYYDCTVDITAVLPSSSVDIDSQGVCRDV